MSYSTAIDLAIPKPPDLGPIPIPSMPPPVTSSALQIPSPPPQPQAAAQQPKTIQNKKKLLSKRDPSIARTLPPHVSVDSRCTTKPYFAQFWYKTTRYNCGYFENAEEASEKVESEKERIKLLFESGKLVSSGATSEENKGATLKRKAPAKQSIKTGATSSSTTPQIKKTKTERTLPKHIYQTSNTDNPYRVFIKRGTSVSDGCFKSIADASVFVAGEVQKYADLKKADRELKKEERERSAALIEKSGGEQGAGGASASGGIKTKPKALMPAQVSSSSANSSSSSSTSSRSSISSSIVSSSGLIGVNNSGVI